jgi:hypothetical protein
MRPTLKRASLSEPKELKVGYFLPSHDRFGRLTACGDWMREALAMDQLVYMRPMCSTPFLLGKGCRCQLLSPLVTTGNG